MVRQREFSRQTLRIDLGGMSSARAALVLEDAAPIIERAVGHGPDRDDLLAIARVAALEAAITERPTESSVLARVAVARRRLRRLRSHAPQLRSPLAPITTDPEWRYLRELVECALARLSPRESAVMCLWLSGHTFDEIGNKIGIERQAAWDYYQDALGRLRRWLDLGLS